LPVNLVIVSTWARTGWNVIRPNVLIDATATRDVTAWQQLRGRAMRALRTWTNDCYRLLLVLRSGHSVDGDVPGDLVADVLRPMEQSSGMAAGLRERLLTRGLDALTADQRDSLANELMLTRNKVTHIYELVKAFGSTRQVEYDRPTRVWRRREPIARKHAYETSVDPFAGTLVPGVDHAPLIYANDPRTDLPDDLETRVEETIRGRDPTIVNGWLVASDR
jgi:hypothetical protein